MDVSSLRAKSIRLEMTSIVSRISEIRTKFERNRDYELDRKSKADADDLYSNSLY